MDLYCLTFVVKIIDRTFEFCTAVKSTGVFAFEIVMGKCKIIDKCRFETNPIRPLQACLLYSVVEISTYFLCGVMQATFWFQSLITILSQERNASSMRYDGIFRI